MICEKCRLTAITMCNCEEMKQAETVKHTLIHWTTKDFGEFGAVLYLDGNRVADIHDNSIADDVVTACNSHADLMETLRKLVTLTNLGKNSINRTATWEHAKELLDKLEGE